MGIAFSIFFGSLIRALSRSSQVGCFKDVGRLKLLLSMQKKRKDKLLTLGKLMNQTAKITQANEQSSESIVIKKGDLTERITLGAISNPLSACIQAQGVTPHYSEYEDDSASCANDILFEADFEHVERLVYLTEQIGARTGSELATGKKIVSQKIVVQQSLERYFLLIGGALNDIELNAEEFGIIFNATCQPVLQWGLNISFATRIADNYGVDEISHYDANSTFIKLIAKLQELTFLQEAALVDFCERFWKESHKGDYSVEELCSKLGFELVD
jgi:hypothetical protein